MFAATQSSSQIELDSMSDDKPIHLEGISWDAFELFLELTFGRYVDALVLLFSHLIICARMHAGSYTLDELTKFLHFCDMYQCCHAREFVVSRVFAACFRFHPAQLISLAIKYHVRSLFPFAFQQLAKTPITEITHVLKARNDEWVRARPAVGSTVLLWTRDIARPKGIATEKRFLCRRGESWTGLWSG
jgi:hypothetical protein